MKQHTTSHNIASLITWITLSVLGVFGLVINVIHFLSWYGIPDTLEQEFLLDDNNHDDELLRLSTITTLHGNEWLQPTRLPLLKKEHQPPYGTDYYIVFGVDGQTHAQRVTTLVENQILLWLSTLWLLALVGLILYFISRYAAKRSLRDVHTITDHIKHTTTDTLDRPLSIPHLRNDDELQPIIQWLNTSNRNLHHQLNTIKQFVSGVSHEFRTPLAILQAKIQLAKIKDNPSDVLESIESQGKSMQKLLDTLLLLTTIEKHTIATEVVDLHPLIDHIDIDHAWIYAQKHITSLISGASTLHTHPWLASLILTNLIDNAYKHAPTHSTITITLSPDSLTIANDGDMLDQHTIDMMFEPFWQGDRSKQSAWFWLGLALVQQSADALGRSVSASARETWWCLITILFS